jgi:hypothetical protein
MNKVDRYLEDCFNIISKEWNPQERFDKIKSMYEKVEPKISDLEIWDSIRTQLIKDITNGVLERDIATLTYHDFLEITKLNKESLKQYFTLRMTQK